MKTTQIILALVMFISSQIFAQKEIDKMPEIKGGIQELAKNIKYPKSAKENGIQGPGSPGA